MSLNINRVMLAGNLTRDPQVRFFANERAVADFGLAVNRRYKGSDGQTKEETTFVDVEAWGRTAELVGQYLTKGRGCYIEGRLRLDTWDDKKDGSKRSKLKVVADNVQFIGGRGEGGERPSQAGSDEAAPGDASPEPAKPSRPAPPAAGGEDEPPF